MVKLIPALIAVTLLVGACATVPHTISDAGPRAVSELPVALERDRVVDDALVVPAVDGPTHVMRLPELHLRPEHALPQVSPPPVSARSATTLISFPRLSEPDTQPKPTESPNAVAVLASDPGGATAPAAVFFESGGLHEPAVPPAPAALEPAQPVEAPRAALPPRVVPTASTIAPPPVPAASAPVDRTVSTTVGEETVVRLDGENWLFLGSNPDGVVYRRRRLLDGATELVLRPDRAGEYRLDFQRQDLLRGEREELAVTLNVSDRRTQRESAAADSGDSGRVGSPDESRIGDATGPDDTMISGEPPFDPIAEAIASIDTDDPAVISAAASAARETGNRDLAAALWRRNRDLETQYGTEARVGLFEVSVAAGRLVDAVSYADRMVEHREAPPAVALIALTDALFSAGDGSTAATAIERTLALRSDSTTDDELLFRLARHYETDPGERNLRRSLGYYRRIAGEFPLSRHWETSRSRIEHIERHFFHVR